jgi:transposase
MQERYVGLDVHSKWSSFVVQGKDGTVVGRGQIATTAAGFRQLRSDYALPAGTRVGLETGTMAFFAARQLQGLDLEPVVIDAYEVRLKAHRPQQKSDRRDAVEICDGLRREIYRSIVHVPPEPIVKLRETLAQRRHFVRVQSAQIMAVKHLLRAAGLGRSYGALQWESAWQRLKEGASDPRILGMIESHHAVWRAAGAQVETLEESLLDQSKAFEDAFRRLQTIPGVGPVVALTAIAAFSDVGRFPSAKHAASYVGLVPSTSQSGDRDWHGHITKKGSPELRAMLVQAAHHSFRKSHPLNPYFRKLCVTRGYKRAVVAIAHRLCRMMYAMLRDQADFDLRKLDIEVGPFERKIIEPYRLKRKTTVQA